MTTLWLELAANDFRHSCGFVQVQVSHLFSKRLQ
jgi:hypothetical protein